MFVFCGERAGISMTVILSLAIYLTIVANFIPPASPLGVPIIIYWVFGGLFIACVIHVLIIISLHPPELLERIVGPLPTRLQGHVKKSWFDYLLGIISYFILSIFMIFCYILASAHTDKKIY